MRSMKRLAFESQSPSNATAQHEAADSFDVVVIGAGHNGLTCACYLARAGLRVAVLDRGERIGGMAISAPLIADAPSHLVSPCAVDGIFLGPGGVAEDLGLRRFGFSQSVHGGYGWIGPNGESLSLTQDVDATVRDVARYSSTDAQRYRELVRTGIKCVSLQDRLTGRAPTRPGLGDMLAWAGGLAADRRIRQLFTEILTRSAADLIASTFESRPLRALFANVATGLGGPAAPDSGVAFLFPSILHRHGFTRVHRGFGGLIQALEGFLVAHGGTVELGAEVQAITSRGGRATGVELTDGRHITAFRAVVGAVAPQHLAEIASCVLPKDVVEAMQWAPANADGVGPFTVNVALSGRVHFAVHQPLAAHDLRGLTITTGTFEEVLESYEMAGNGQISERLPWWITVLTDTAGNAPKGQDVAWFYAAVPVRPADGWSVIREKVADSILHRAAKYIPTLGKASIGLHIETPVDLAGRVNTPNGNAG